MSNARRVVVILGAGGTLGTALSRHLAAEPDTDLVLSDLAVQARSIGDPATLIQTISGRICSARKRSQE